jgi:4-hydroxyphenylpyruvate dioxygenase-like putative hemolysin
MAGEQKPRVKLGPVHHVGIVVKDVDQAVQYYSSVFGLGPFKTQVYEMDERTNFTYRGQPAHARVKAAFAQSGPVAIELVEVLEGKTPHTEFLTDKGEGVQHVAFQVDNLIETLADLAKDGIEPILRYSMTIEQPTLSKSNKAGEAKTELFEVNEVYLNSDRIGGTVIQLIEVKRRSPDLPH